MIHDAKPSANNLNYVIQTRLINVVTVSKFTMHVKNENWESVFNSYDVDSVSKHLNI
jgi:DNA replication protein DnaC